jgi:cell wall-associated NlpC family hydrolase
MRFLFSIIYSLFLITAFPQERQIKKSKKLFEKDKYDKCISKTKKYLKKYRKNADLQYYIVLSNIALYDEKSDSKKIFQLKKVLRSWDKLINYSLEDGKFNELSITICLLIHKEIKNPKVNSGNKKHLHIQLAESFGDTTDYYKNNLLIKKTGLINNGKSYSTPIALNHSDSLRTTLLVCALNQIGSPYKYGGVDSTGFDCSGFTQYLYHKIGIMLPHNAQLQSELGQLIDLEEAQTGDLIFFGEKRAAHAGMIYINKNGETELIHCVSRGVSHDTEKDNNHIYWMNRPYKIKRYIQFDSAINNH